jgi:hypothetical protein
VLLSANGQTVSSDLAGNYAISNLCSGPFSITPALPGYRFQPVVLSGNLSENTTDLNFVGFPALTLTLASKGSVRLAFPALTTSQVQGSTNLQAWQTLFATNNFSTNTPVFQFTDTNAPNFRTRFYRVAQAVAGLPRIVVSNPASPPVFISAPVTNCQVVASTNLTDWTPVFSTNQTFSNAPFQFTDTNAPILLRRFYRISQSPGF